MYITGRVLGAGSWKAEERRVLKAPGPLPCTIQLYNQIYHGFQLKVILLWIQILSERKDLILKASVLSVGTVASPTTLVPSLMDTERSCLILHPWSPCFHMLHTPCTPNLLAPRHGPHHPPPNKAESTWQTELLCKMIIFSLTLCLRAVEFLVVLVSLFHFGKVASYEILW